MIPSRYDSHPGPGHRYAGFPRTLAALLRCPADGSELSLETLREGATHVEDGVLKCGRCSQIIPIVAGIARTLAPERLNELNEEERHEVALRDAQARTLAPEREHAYWSSGFSAQETASTMAELDLDGSCTAVDLGCGTGRYTSLLAGACRWVVAVDFSLESLRWLVREDPPGPNVGLVHGDITRLRLAPRRFDRALATTPLDSREQRLAMHHVVGDALADGGVYVFSVEHYDLRSKLLGAPRAQRYRPGGNLFFRLKREEVVREAAPYFLRVRSRPINAVLPLGRFMPEWLHVGLSRIAERVPGLRQFGDLVLVRATRPLRAVEEEAAPNGSRLYCYLHRLTHRSQRSRARVA